MRNFRNTKFQHVGLGMMDTVLLGVTLDWSQYHIKYFETITVHDLVVRQGVRLTR